MTISALFRLFQAQSLDRKRVADMKKHGKSSALNVEKKDVFLFFTESQLLSFSTQSLVAFAQEVD